uniref:Uncharacterized protein n=1 Tax=Arundo donax TaxID=35708 RepID=A0A0A9CMV9_ARUDO
MAAGGTRAQRGGGEAGALPGSPSPEHACGLVSAWLRRAASPRCPLLEVAAAHTSSHNGGCPLAHLCPAAASPRRRPRHTTGGQRCARQVGSPRWAAGSGKCIGAANVKHGNEAAACGS